MAVAEVLFGFIISLIVSAIIVYVAARMLGEKEGFGTALLVALIGAFIFALASYFIGTGWIASLIAGVAWLVALGTMYRMGWLKSLGVAVVIWILAAIVSMVLPTVAGPL